MAMGLWRAAPWRAQAPACPDLSGLGWMGMVEEGLGKDMGASLFQPGQLWVS